MRIDYGVLFPFPMKCYNSYCDFGDDSSIIV